MGKLTALKAKALRAPGRHSDGNGLTLFIKDSGAKSWVLRIQVNGKRRDIGLGSFDTVSLAEAREKADDIRKQFRNGIDPVAAKRAVITAAPTIPTFREAASIAHGEHKGGWKNAKHKAQWLSSLEAYAFPLIGDVPVHEVDGPAIRDLLAKIWLSKPETARRVRQRIGTVLDWAYAKGYRQAEAPTRSVTKGLPKQPKKDSHFAALPYEQAPAVYAQLSSAESIGRLALRFLILTAARSGEVRGTCWREIDLEQQLWTIPGDRMKAGKTHIVPLQPAAIEILDTMARMYGTAPDQTVFPGRSNKQLSDMTLTKVLRDGFVGDITVHGFRSTFRDWAAEQTDVAGDVVEAALAHAVQNKVEAAYRRTNYLEKRRGLMLAWSNHLLTTLAANQTD
ncbi:integrase arm-type DNA-binding domain-containing protein [Sphingomonas yunnanensis]|uniref:tyrosine-type recombinase/integrase n=1 Tax=Sphingomonas yunnanensis TaxID=310400 RepID=UPI001CA74511|nr:integrase arm-type DNA-binding domain-containing protein [Sphingomonas yunnanensis]MBY9064958.1 integrase arm-type DNA-binding domain-containing protein [Sphingomonas yunnanensis]